MAVCGIPQVNAGINILIQHRGLQLFRDQLFHSPSSVGVCSGVYRQNIYICHQRSLNGVVHRQSRLDLQWLCGHGSYLAASDRGHGLQLIAIQQIHSYRHIAILGGHKPPGGQICGEGRSNLRIGRGVGFLVSGQSQAVVNVLPSAFVILVVDWHAVRNSKETAVTKAEMFFCFGAERNFFADDGSRNSFALCKRVRHCVHNRFFGCSQHFSQRIQRQNLNKHGYNEHD